MVNRDTHEGDFVKRRFIECGICWDKI